MKKSWQDIGFVGIGVILAVLAIFVYNAGPSNLLQVVLSLAVVLLAIYCLLRMRNRKSSAPRASKAMSKIAKSIVITLAVAAIIFAALWAYAIAHI